MKSAIVGLITLIFSGCAMMAGLNSGNIWTGYGLAAVAWLLFIRHCKRMKKQAAERRFREQQLQLFIRTMQKQH